MKGAMATFKVWDGVKKVLSVDWRNGLVGIGGEGGLEVWKVGEETAWKDIFGRFGVYHFIPFCKQHSFNKFNFLTTLSSANSITERTTLVVHDLVLFYRVGFRTRKFRQRERPLKHLEIDQSHRTKHQEK
jgi:hypothetical protein